MAEIRHCDQHENDSVEKYEIDVWICRLCGAFSTVQIIKCPDPTCRGVMKMESRNYNRSAHPDSMADA
jgi:hypothetical protein